MVMCWRYLSCSGAASWGCRWDGLIKKPDLKPEGRQTAATPSKATVSCTYYKNKFDAFMLSYMKFHQFLRARTPKTRYYCSFFLKSVCLHGSAHVFTVFTNQNLSPCPKNKMCASIQVYQIANENIICSRTRALALCVCMCLLCVCIFLDPRAQRTKRKAHIYRYAHK
jgi:hypothetical protein